MSKDKNPIDEGFDGIMATAIDTTGVVFEDKTVTFDDTVQTIEATNLPEGATVVYSGGDKKFAGNYVVTATISVDGEEDAVLTANLTINKKTASVLTGVKFADKSVKFTGTEQTLIATDIPAGVTATYSNNKQTAVGEIEVTVTYKEVLGAESGAEQIGTAKAKLTVTKKDASSLDTVTFADKSVKFTGTEHTLIATTLPTGVTATYATNKLTKVGSVTAVATFNEDLGTGTPESIGTKDAKLTVTKKDASSLDAVTFADKSVKFTGVPHTVEAGNLPTGVTVSYATNSLTKVGSVTAVATFNEDLGTGTPESIGTKEAKLTITKKDQSSIDGVKFDSITTPYTGTEHELQQATNIPKGVTVKYSGTTKLTTAGSVEYTADFYENLGDDLETKIGTKIAKLTITKLPKPNLDGIVFEDTVLTWTGKEQEVVATNLPEGVTATYVDNKLTDIGFKNATATFKANLGAPAGTEIVGTKTIRFEIAKIEAPSLDGVVFKSITVKHNDEQHSIEATNLPEGVTVTYTGQPVSNVGVHEVVATFKFKTGPTVETIGTKKAMITITKIDAPDLSNVKFLDKKVTWDGQPHTIEATDLPEGVTVEYEGQPATEIGPHEITAKFMFDTGDVVEQIGTKVATLTIEKIQAPSLDDVVFQSITVEHDGEPHSIEATNIPEEVTVEYTGQPVTEPGVHDVTATFKFKTGPTVETIGTKKATITINSEEEVIPPAPEGAMAEVITIILLEDTFEYLRVGKELAGIDINNLTQEQFFNFMEAYLPEEALSSNNHYRLVELYNSMKG